VENLVSLTVAKPQLPTLTGTSAMLIVEDADSYELGVSMCADAKAEWKKWDGQREALKAGSLKACRDIDLFFKPVLEFFAREEDAIKIKLLAFRKKEAAAAAERQAEANRIAAEEQARLRKLADAAAKKGNADKAEALREQAAVTAPVEVVRENLKVSGSSARQKWVVTVTDKAAFLKEAASIPLLHHSIDIDTGKLAKLAQATGQALNHAGITCAQEEILAIGAAR